jgi:hypothetical protein
VARRKHLHLIFVIGDFLSKYWKNSWVLVALRLIKSGIEYVILAGSSFFPLSGAKSRFPPATVVVVARAARDFSRKMGFGTWNLKKIAGSQGPELNVGSPAL